MHRLSFWRPDRHNNGIKSVWIIQMCHLQSSLNQQFLCGPRPCFWTSPFRRAALLTLLPPQASSKPSPCLQSVHFLPSLVLHLQKNKKERAEGRGSSRDGILNAPFPLSRPLWINFAQELQTAWPLSFLRANRSTHGKQFQLTLWNWNRKAT